MELPQIKHFINLADTLNFTDAARLSNVAQPSLTKSIKKLEDELGGILIYRDGRDTRLTALGREVLVEFTRIMKIEESIYKLANNSIRGRKKILNLGVSSTVSPKPISRFINNVLVNMPTLQINLHPLYKVNSVDELLAGRYDGCFLGDKPMENRKLSAISLFEEDFHVACSKAHKFASMKIVPIEYIRHEMYVDRLLCEYRSRILEQFMLRDVLMSPRFASEREDWVQQVVAGGHGICMLPRFSVISDDIVTRPVEQLDIQRTVVFASVSGSGNAAALQQVRMMAKDHDWKTSVQVSKQ
jgi:LysR family hydrogen peroxide-inducible transcriptional activator